MSGLEDKEVDPTSSSKGWTHDVPELTWIWSNRMMMLRPRNLSQSSEVAAECGKEEDNIVKLYICEVDPSI